MTISDERPDGRTTTPETRRLRAATRALRLHLDTLPIDFTVDCPPDQFLTGLAFMSARQRYDCAESMIGAGFGGTTLGALSRSLFVDALRWIWIASAPGRRKALLGDLIRERSGLCDVLDENGSTCGVLPRWLQPLPDIADLIGRSEDWAQIEPVPDEAHLLADFFAARQGEADAGQSDALQRARSLLITAELRSAALVLAHAGHGNYLGMQSSLAEGAAIGHDLRFDHEALFMQVAAAGAVATLVGSSVAATQWWPQEVPVEAFLDTAIRLAGDVSAAAVDVHHLVGRGSTPRTPTHAPDPLVVHRRARLAPADLLPDATSPTAVVAGAEGFYAFARSLPIDPWLEPDPVLHIVLGWGAAHSTLEAVMAMYDQPGAAVVAPFAARQLLEEAARTVWRFSVSDPADFEARATQFFDDSRARRSKAIGLLVASGVPRPVADSFFALPSNVDSTRVRTDPTPGRLQLPSIATMIGELGQPFPEPGWLNVAYSLLSQITHNTPLGLLHTVRVVDGTLSGTQLSPEMLALSLDVSCFASAHLLGYSALLLTGMSPEALEFQRGLMIRAASVHDRARMVHGLD